jgi:hypothetical protein
MAKVRFHLDFKGNSTAVLVVKGTESGKVSVSDICKIYGLPANEHFKKLVGDYIVQHAPKGRNHLQIGWYWQEQEDSKLAFVNFQKQCLSKKEVFAAIKEGYEFFGCISNYCDYILSENRKEIITEDWCKKMNENNL